MLLKMIMPAGILLVFFLSDILFGNTFLSANVKSGLLVIVGPVLGAVLVHGFPAIKSLWERALRIFDEDEGRDAALVKEIGRLAYSWQAHGYRGLEKASHQIIDPLLRTGVVLVADGCKAEEVCKILRRKSRIYFTGRSAEGDILRVLAGQAQSFGLVGTVIGMIAALGSIGNPVAVGNGISMALCSVLYGLLLANLVYRPLHKKFKVRLRRDYKSHMLIMAGVNYLADGKSSRAINYRLQSFLDREEQDLPRRSRLEPVVRHSFNGDGVMVSRTG